jgi:hypothetical protein
MASATVAHSSIHSRHNIHIGTRSHTVVEQEEPKHFLNPVTPQSRGAAEREQQGSLDPPQGTWRKSSWSTYNGNCVEVAKVHSDLVGVRDTKEAGAGSVLLFSGTAWRSFITRVKNSEHI